MPSVTEHYENHLAPIYVWMAGGMDAAITRGHAEVNAVCPRPLHAIPLADIGYSVLAIDSSGTLLDAMQSHIGARPIKTVKDDLLCFRHHLIGLKRFIPVGDADRILTCFLEYGDDAVTVHDILHERDGSDWRQRVSAYRKLRLSPDWVAGTLEAKGLAGMIRLIAKLPV
jgi:hypothetical protein